MGVVGKWGSGKSSLLNLTCAAIKSLDRSDRPYISEFKPWLVGDRDALLRALFAELANAVDSMEYEAGDATGRSIASAKKAAEAIREFAANLVVPAKATKAAGVILPWLGPVGVFVEGLTTAAKEKNAPSLAKLKAKVVRRLKRLSRAVIVIIDDVDRLEPREVVEIFRLVRSVADFPNVTYILGYDIDKVAHAVARHVAHGLRRAIAAHALYRQANAWAWPHASHCTGQSCVRC